MGDGRVLGDRRLCVLLFTLVLASCATDAASQMLFGKNKVVYESREWMVFQQGNVHVYYYPEEEDLARFTLRVGVETYAEYAQWFDFEFDEPVPLILYATHHDLKQTHVIPSFVSDGTAGFTEFAKGRIALRATGNRAELVHLIRHEMVHAFMLAKLAVVMNEREIFDYEGPPLWFVEGLAESVANPQPDARAHMVMRDAVLNDGLVPIPEMWQIWGSFQMYKQGESIVDFLRLQYGDRVPAQLLERWWRARDFEQLLELELGIDLHALDQKWRTYLKRRYFPEILRRQHVAERGRAIDDRGFFDTMPAVVGLRDDGTLELVCLSAREGTISLYFVEHPPRAQARFTLLVEGETQSSYESLPLLRSRIDLHDGRWVAFVAKHGRQDVVYVYDLQARRVTEEYRIEPAVELSSPAFSPDGSRIVVSMLARSGWSDLVVVERDTGTWTQLTDDVHHDTHPDWHPDGSRVVFASDRDDAQGGLHGLYDIDAQGRGPIRTRVLSAADDTEPVWSRDGRSLYFVSDRDGARNVYRLDPSVDQVAPVTDLTGGVFGPALVEPAAMDSSGVDAEAAAPPSETELVLSVYQDRRFRLFRVPVGEPDRAAVSPAIMEAPHSGAPSAQATPLEDTPAVPMAYEIDLGLDFVQSVVALDPDLPYGSGASLGFTDLLGNHQVYGHLGTATDELKLEDLNFGLTYSALGQRWNRHYGLFRVAVRQRASLFLRPRYSEVRTGGFFGLTYPFSKFRRLEMTTVLRHLERDDSFQLPGEPGETWLWSGFVSFVHDNTLWTWDGPARGMRWNLTAGQTFDLLGRGFDRQTVQIDARRYDSLGRGFVLAHRAQWRASFGSDSQFFFLGGPNDLRGFDWFAFFGDRTLLFNTELRLPLVERLSLRLPMAGIDLPPIRANLLNDVAKVSGRFDDTGWIGAFGASFSMTLFPPLVLRYDVVRPHDFERIEDWDRRFSLSFLY